MTIPSRLFWAFAAGIAGAAAVAGASNHPAVRTVFLNGIDISAARSQELKNVDVQITEQGDIYIVAPHYQVTEEDNYVPLAKYAAGLKAPEHRPAAPVPSEPKATYSPPAGTPPGAPIPKAGEAVNSPVEQHPLVGGSDTPPPTDGAYRRQPGGSPSTPGSESPPPPPLPGDDPGVAAPP